MIRPVCIAETRAIRANSPIPNIRTLQSYHEPMLVQHAVALLDLKGMALASDGLRQNDSGGGGGKAAKRKLKKAVA